MTLCVVEVGPESIRGRSPVPQQQISAALESIDDRFAILEGGVVAVAELWCDVLHTSADGCGGPVVVVVPTWWPAGRVEVVTVAARAVFAEVAVVQRSILAANGDATVVELSAEWAVVTSPSAESVVLARGSRDVEALLAASSSVLLDTPLGVRPLSTDAIVGLRRLAVPFAHSSPQRMGAAAEALGAERSRRARHRPGRRTGAVMAGIALSVGAAGGIWAAQAFTAHPNPGGSTRMLTEGRVTVAVPAAWTAERVTAGTGSDRVRVAPQAGMPALHITQSVGAQTSLEQVAEALRSAMTFEPGGVFVEFRPAGERGGRPAVTYVERRGDTETRWAVLVDGATRIAIGCQHPNGHPEHIEDVCGEAVRSARAAK